MFSKGLESATNYLNKYGKDNEEVTGLIHGGFVDAALTQMKGGLSLNYNQAMSSHLAKLNEGMENLKTGNQLKLMGTEGRIARQLIGKQGTEQRRGIRVTGEQQRLGIRETGYQDRMGVRERTQAQKNLRADARGAIRRSGARFFG